MSYRLLDQNGNAIDYTRRAPRMGGISLRTHEAVLVRTDVPLDVPALVARAKGDGGGQWFYEKVKELQRKREALARRRAAGEACRDEEAEGLSFSTVGDVKALRKALDFEIQVQVPSEGGVRMVTTSAFALLTSSMAVADLNTAYESVPTVVEQLVQDMDDDAPNTEVGQTLDFGHLSPTDDPKPLGETEEYREVGAGEDRYTILAFKDGYMRAFSQELLDRGGPRVFSDLMDLGIGTREILELFALKKIIDYHGSKRRERQASHVMIRNRSAAALYSVDDEHAEHRAPRTARGSTEQRARRRRRTSRSCAGAWRRP
jgi:hypothetical protein